MTTDNSDRTLTPVSGWMEVAQAVIRAAPPQDRERLWQRYLSLMAAAQRDHEDRMPWEPPETVAWIDSTVGKEVLMSMLKSISDRELLGNLAHVAGDKLVELEARDMPLQGQRGGAQQCGRVGCANTFTPARASRRYCSPACRQRAYKLRQRP